MLLILVFRYSDLFRISILVFRIYLSINLLAHIKNNPVLLRDGIKDPWYHPISPKNRGALSRFTRSGFPVGYIINTLVFDNG
jgi:hypothetical protein